jgi:hypothetical protein
MKTSAFKKSVDKKCKLFYNKYTYIKRSVKMEFSFSLNIRATKEAVWAYYENIEKWYDWEEDLKNITLKGGFETGSYGTMELEGMPPMEYQLTLVKPLEEFWDKTATPFGDILFGHQIIENNDGTVNVRHTVSLDSEDKKHLEFLSQVFSDVPHSIFILKNYLER